MKWRHTNGNIYEIIYIANEHSTNPKYVPTVDESELEFKNGNHYYKKYKVEYIIRNS